MRKEGFRLPSARQDYNADAEATIGNEISASIGRLLPIKTFRDTTKECVDNATTTLDAQVRAEQDDARVGHEARQLELTTAANTAINAWNNSGSQGQQPPAHLVQDFVAVMPRQTEYAERLHVLQNEATISSVLCILTTGLAMKELYDDVPTKTASEKLAAGHATALRASSVVMSRAIRGLPLTQAYAALLSKLTKSVLSSWKQDVQGYTEAHLASGIVKANKATLAKTVTIAAAYDGVRSYTDAFASIYPPAAQGYAELLADSLLEACEPVLQQHLRSMVAPQKLHKWAGLAAPDFAERIAEQARLAHAKINADGAVRERAGARTVAALELVIAGLRADHGRLEQQVRQQGLQQQPPREQRQRPRVPLGQVVGSATYSGCNFMLPNGEECKNMKHNRRNHPA